MAFTFGFYNSVNNDRKYDATQIGRLFDGVIKDGVFMSIGEKFIVREGEGMIVIVGSGRAWFDHTWSLNDAPMPIEIEQSEVLQDRIDTIVLDIDSSTQLRTNSITVVKGVPSTSPVPPTLIQTFTKHQYPLGDIFVKRGVTEIKLLDITNRVGTSDTPFVTGILDTVNIDALLRQWRGQFDDWIRMLGELLDENTAANLAALIMNHIDDKITKVEGIHGLKYENDKLYIFENEKWTLAGGIGGESSDIVTFSYTGSSKIATLPLSTGIGSAKWANLSSCNINMTGYYYTAAATTDGKDIYYLIIPYFEDKMMVIKYSIQNDTWAIETTRGASMSDFTANRRGFSHDGRLYVASGNLGSYNNSQAKLNTLTANPAYYQYFDVRTKTWGQINRPDRVAFRTAFGGIGDKLYFAGGYSIWAGALKDAPDNYWPLHTFDNRLRRFNLASLAWSDLAPLPLGYSLYGHLIGVGTEDLYYLYGKTSGSAAQQVDPIHTALYTPSRRALYRFNLTNQQFTECATPNIDVENVSYFVSGSEINFITPGASPSMHIYNTITNQWRIGTPPPAGFVVPVSGGGGAYPILCPSVNGETYCCNPVAGGIMYKYTPSSAEGIFLGTLKKGNALSASNLVYLDDGASVKEYQYDNSTNKNWFVADKEYKIFGAVGDSVNGLIVSGSLI